MKGDDTGMCMQDLCMGFWPLDRDTDMILKVVDICSTDPSDPTHCPTPADIKVDRAKAQMLFNLPSNPEGDVYPEKVGWFFTKCWAEVCHLSTVPFSLSSSKKRATHLYPNPFPPCLKHTPDSLHPYIHT